MTTLTDTEVPDRAATGNPWAAAGLSLIIPGSGHLYLRRWLRAAVWAFPIVIIVLAYVLADVDRFDLVGAAFSKPTLWMIFGLNIAAAVWRVASAVDAWRRAAKTVSGPSPFSVAVIGGFAIFLAIVIPHLFVARTTIDAVRLVDIVFAGDAGPPDTPVIPIGTDADIVLDPVITRYDIERRTETRFRSRMFEDGFGDPDAVAVWEQEVQRRQDAAHGSPFLPFSERVGTDRITILLAGGDAGPGRGGLRTDTVMLATINPETGKAALFGFPRNLGRMPLPPSWEDAFVDLEIRILEREGTDGTTTTVPAETTSTTAPTTTTTIPFVSCECFPEQLNALYPFTRRWTSTYPTEVDPGMAALRDVLSYNTGLRIDYYVLVDMAAFVDLVEAIGGVDVYVTEPLKAEVSPPREGDPWATVDVDVGWHRLDGFEALAFVRSRTGSSDYARMQRQRCMLRAVAAKSTPVTLLRGFGGIVDALDGSMVTDLPLSFGPDLLEMTARLDFNDIVTFGFNPGYYAPTSDSLHHPVPDTDRIKQKIRSVIVDQDAGIGLEGTGETSECDG